MGGKENWVRRVESPGKLEYMQYTLKQSEKIVSISQDIEDSLTETPEVMNSQAE